MKRHSLKQGKTYLTKRKKNDVEDSNDACPRCEQIFTELEVEMQEENCTPAEAFIRVQALVRELRRKEV
jgi:acetyl-CoA carboxylase beta subunit